MRKVIKYIKRHKISILLTILQLIILFLIGVLLGTRYSGDELVYVVILIGISILLEGKITEIKNKEYK